MKAFCKHLVSVTVMVGAIAYCDVVNAHKDFSEEDLEKIKAGEYDKDIARVLAREPHKMDEGLRDRAVYKIRKAALEAAGFDDTAIANALASGPQRAFPFSAQPELTSQGTVKTLTILIDFKDRRAANELPGLTVDNIRNNIYGSGNSAHFPHESLHNYYSRASQGKVDVQGTVLGWHHFPKNRKTYEPSEPPSDTPEDELADAQAFLDNAANFKLASEALDALDANHDFSQYDNDNDGDIDLLTIMYAGPPGDWASFWWAYRWEFFVPDAAAKKFDGKKLKQFVFQFVETRGSNDDDYDPTTLLHEMGHAFGLADYYDYKPGVGPDGGVGGLDMMHANQGNQNAFSRWLLDWIEVSVLGSGPPQSRQLKGSSSSDAANKAIAIFPGLANPLAPKQEMFLIEHRPKVGNDAKLPGDGILIWHVEASLNAAGTRFRNDNSFTNRKLIRLVRANKAADFNHNEPATAATYFKAGKDFTPTSMPNSNGYADVITHIAIDQLAVNGEDATLRIGFLSVPGPSPAALAGNAQVQPSEAASSDQEPTEAEAGAVAETIKALASSEADAPIDLDALEKLDRQLTSATPAQLREAWDDLGAIEESADKVGSASITRQLLLTHWAAKEGEPAVKALLAAPAEREFVQDAYPQVMQSWAHRSPADAAKWYLGEENAQLRNSKHLDAGSDFAERVFKPLYLTNKDKAIAGLAELKHTAEVVGAVAGLREASKAVAGGADQLKERLEGVEPNAGLIQAAQQLLEAEDAVESAALEGAAAIDDPQKRAEFQDIVRQRSLE